MPSLFHAATFRQQWTQCFIGVASKAPPLSYSLLILRRSLSIWVESSEVSEQVLDRHRARIVAQSERNAESENLEETQARTKLERGFAGHDDVSTPGDDVSTPCDDKDGAGHTASMVGGCAHHRQSAFPLPGVPHFENGRWSKESPPRKEGADELAVGTRQPPTGGHRFAAAAKGPELSICPQGGKEALNVSRNDAVDEARAPKTQQARANLLMSGRSGTKGIGTQTSKTAAGTRQMGSEKSTGDARSRDSARGGVTNKVQDGADDASAGKSPSTEQDWPQLLWGQLEHSEGNQKLLDAFAGSGAPQTLKVPSSTYFLTQVEELLLGLRRPHKIAQAGYSVKLDRPLDNLPGRKDARAADDTVFAKEPRLIAAARTVSDFPLPNLPEIAFAGRSNVGKSSLINAFSRRTHITKVSDKPGETQTINFYGIGSRLSLVDLPGYGFAYAADEKRQSWSDLMEHYLQTRRSLRRVMLLIDSRHSLKVADLEMIDMLESNRVRYQLVLTKADMVPPVELARRATAAQLEMDRRSGHVSPLAMVSSRTGAGLLKLRAALSGLAVRR